MLLLGLWDEKCQEQLDELICKLEEEGDRGTLTDTEIRSMLKQAIGLAKHMGRDHVADTLKELMDDPVSVRAIKDDKLTRDVLRKILVMRKLAEKDARKKAKLKQLERYNSGDEEDSSLREFIRQSDALCTSPKSAGNLKKSKSMVKKSKSMIMTAKDIPMNAFMAMKNTADQKDENWLQNFLSESVVEEVPWECSKALIILKEGFQAIIPREASRSILLGEASYTLIDDNGIEFYLSAADKKKREKGGGKASPSPEKKSNTSGKQVTISDVLSEDKTYQRAKINEQKEVGRSHFVYALGLLGVYC